MLKTKIRDAEAALSERRKALKGLFDEAGPELKMTAEQVDEVRKLNDELDDLGAKLDDLRMVEKAAARVIDGDDDAAEAPPTKTKRDPFDLIAAGVVKAAGSKGTAVPVDVSLKTLFDTSAGWAPETTRGPRVVDLATRPVQVAPLIPQTTTNQTAVTYMEETTFTNAAAETAEGGSKPEAALALTEKSSAVRKIAVWIPVTDEQLEDVPRIRQYLENRLGFMVRQRLDLQILVGNGTPPNLRGLLNVSGIQTQAKGADPVPDAVYKALTKVRVTGQAMPDLVVFNPNDWQDVRLLRTADGIYIWGSPSDAGPERIWGIQVAQAQALTENTGLVVDTQFVELAVRKGLELAVSDSHSTYFVENKQAIRAEMRAALVAYRPAAICTVTGI